MSKLILSTHNKTDHPYSHAFTVELRKMRLIFGSMRLHMIQKADCVELLTHALSLGIRRFHSSTEYESFEIFCKSLKAACLNAEVDMNSLKHIVKIGEPDFDEITFNENSFLQKLHAYQINLEIECIDVVQWMIRGNLKNDKARLDSLNNSSETINDVIVNLKAENKIKSFGCFPYSDLFRKSVMEKSWCDILVDYVNPIETTARDTAIELPPGKRLIGIRPLLPLTHAESRIRNQWSLEELMEYGLSSPNLDALIVSSSTTAHLDELIALTKFYQR